MKIKDLPKNQSLCGVKVKTPCGKIGKWKSQWDKGVWLDCNDTNEVTPIFVDALSETLEWEVIEAPTLS